MGEQEVDPREARDGVQGERHKLHPRLRLEDGVRRRTEHGLRAAVRQPRGGEEVRAEAPPEARRYRRCGEGRAPAAQGRSQEAEEDPRQGEGEGRGVSVFLAMWDGGAILRI